MTEAVIVPSTTFRAKYYCGERKSLFSRNIVIDDTLEMKRKVNGAEFATIVTGTGDNKRIALIMRKINGEFVALRGESASVPAYLFGPEYLKAQRLNPDVIWDFRKAAFSPMKASAHA